MKGKQTKLDAAAFGRGLLGWYRVNARRLPWRGVRDPYRIWLSEVMLQQTRVAAVIAHYREFVRRFPTLKKLAGATEQEVLAAWSGLGYYRRARMLHKAAKVVVEEMGGRIPKTAAELRELPGVGEYTAAAVASIAFGERVAVVDGNVERVLLRLHGRGEDRTAVGRRWLRETAGELIDAGGGEKGNVEAAGRFNQAMMELGAVVCVPKGPLCGECPVRAVCRTQGEHATASRGKMGVKHEAYLLAARGGRVLLVQRGADERRMAGMWELPEVSVEDAARLEPVARVRHSITTTNYAVAVVADAELEREVRGGRWVAAGELGNVALTGLARKILSKMDVL